MQEIDVMSLFGQLNRGHSAILSNHEISKIDSLANKVYLLAEEYDYYNIEDDFDIPYVKRVLEENIDSVINWAEEILDFLYEKGNYGDNEVRITELEEVIAELKIIR